MAIPTQGVIFYKNVGHLKGKTLNDSLLEQPKLQ